MDIGFVQLAMMGHYEDLSTVLEKNSLIPFDQCNRFFLFFENI